MMYQPSGREIEKGMMTEICWYTEEECSCPLNPHYSNWMTPNDLASLASTSKIIQQRMALVVRQTLRH